MFFGDLCDVHLYINFPFFLFFFCALFIVQATLAPLVRLQENVPQFKLPSLETGKDYQLLVYAVNAKGRSNPPYVIDHVRVASLLPYGKLSLMSCSSL